MEILAVDSVSAESHVPGCEGGVGEAMSLARLLVVIVDRTRPIVSPITLHFKLDMPPSFLQTEDFKSAGEIIFSFSKTYVTILTLK